MEEHQKKVSGSESQLETMIKDMRSELAGCREETWRLEQVEELEDMKARLLLGKLSSGAITPGKEGIITSLGGEGGLDSDALEVLDTLNSELDIEMNALMSQLGLVKGEVICLPLLQTVWQAGYVAVDVPARCVWGAPTARHCACW